MDDSTKYTSWSTKISSRLRSWLPPAAVGAWRRWWKSLRGTRAECKVTREVMKPCAPPEIQRMCIRHIDLLPGKRDEETSKTVMRMFCSLRLVDHFFKEVAETLYPAARRRLQEHIVASYLFDPNPKRTREFAEMPEIRCMTDLVFDRELSQLMGSLDTVQQNGLNAILSACRSHLHTLDWDFSFQKVDLSRIQLQLCPGLRHVTLQSLPWGCDLRRLRLERMSQLESLHIIGFNQRHNPPIYLPNQVRSFKLAYCELNTAAIKRIAMVLADLDKLETLDLGGNTPRAEGIMCLNFPQFRFLSQVKLGGSSLDNDGAMTLQLHLSCIKELDLAYNDIDDPNVLRLADNSCLESLNLIGNPLKSLSFGLDKNTTLRLLDISSVKGWGVTYTGQHFASLSRQLEQNDSLRELVMSNFGLKDEGIAGLSNANAKGLQVLNICDNNLREEAIRSIGIHLNPRLKWIVFGPSRHPPHGFTWEVSDALISQIIGNGCRVQTRTWVYPARAL